MKKILVTRRLLRSNEDKLKNLYEVNLNLNDELYSQDKLIELSQGCDGILSALTDKLDEDTINKLPDSVKILSNFAVGFGNIDLQAPKINKIPISAVASVKTSGVLVTAIFLFFAASRSIFPKPTAKLDKIFTLSGNLFIVCSSNLSVNADKIPSHP